MYPGIALSIATGPQLGPYSKSLVAIIQLQQQTAITTTVIRLLPKTRLDAARFSVPDLALFMKSKLPSYMIPNHWIVVEKLPLSVSGKIDRTLVNQWLIGISREMEDSITSNGCWSEAIPKDETTALELSAHVASLLAREDPRFYSALHGQDFLFSALGIDSIQVISLTMSIKRHFGIKVRPGIISHSEATVRGVAKCIEESRATGEEVAVEARVNFVDEYLSCKEAMQSDILTKRASIKAVLVTGATGFLRSQILAQLFTRIEIQKIIVHVRADSPAHGLQRIVHSATLAGWWSNSYLARLEVWIGDLARPKIRLNTEQWDRLAGNVLPSQRIHAIIHNGATVNWNAEFSSLKAANVDSTIELLSVVNSAPSILKLVYVSGGQQHNSERSHQPSALDSATLSTGYAQTKFLSELLVRDFARASPHHASRVAVVKPSYIIGTPTAGIANIDDYIWRLVAACVSISAYNASDASSYLYVSDVASVAASIVAACCDPDLIPAFVSVVDGLPVADFWAVFTQELGYKLRPLAQDEWLAAVHADVEVRREAHPLWPLLHTLETEHGRLGVPAPSPPQEKPKGAALRDREEGEACKRVRAAVRRNVEILQEVGFLRMPDGEKAVADGTAGVFDRSRRRG